MENTDSPSSEVLARHHEVVFNFGALTSTSGPSSEKIFSVLPRKSKQLACQVRYLVKQGSDNYEGTSGSPLDQSLYGRNMESLSLKAPMQNPHPQQRWSQGATNQVPPSKT
eukprot:477569-Amphidinium_carterae.1